MKNCYEHIHWKYAGKSQEQIDTYKEYYKKIFFNLEIKRIHDCSCGSGTLTFPLIYLDYNVSGSDLSEAMIGFAKERAKEESSNSYFFVADFTKIYKKIDSEIDCLISTGNSLAHVENDGISKFIECASKVVKGICTLTQETGIKY